MSGLHRRELVAGLLRGRDGDLLVVAGLGSSCWDVCDAGDRAENFYVWGAMGGATMIGFGVARARPDKRVLVITGDGDMLMGMGSFATIANNPAANFAVLVLDNSAYGETGGQPTHTTGPTDLAAIAKGAGIATTETITKESEVGRLKELMLETPGPVVAVAKILYEPLQFVLPSNNGPYLKDRFRVTILGEGAA